MSSLQRGEHRPLPTVNGQPIRLLASDIDGTLIPYSRIAETGISSRTVEALSAAARAGVQVVLVTGRPVRNMRMVSEVLGGLGPVICSNGAVTYDLAADQLLSADTLLPEMLFAAKDAIADIDPHAQFAAETMDHLHMEQAFAERSYFYDAERRRAAGITEDELLLGPLDETLSRVNCGASRPPGVDHISERVVKLLATSPTLSPEVFLAEAQMRIGSYVSVTHSAPGMPLLEVAVHGMNKAAGLQRFAAEAGIDRNEIIAFGDMPNDLEMLNWAGTSWAVGSAPQPVQHAADRVSPNCEDDGVAQVIEQLLAGQL